MIETHIYFIFTQNKGYKLKYGYEKGLNINT